MATVSYTAAQKSSLTDQAKRWTEQMVQQIMSDDFDADEDSFRTLFQETLNFSRLEIMSEQQITSTNTNKRQKREKKVKDPNAPTKPPTPYILFLWGDKTNPDILGTGKVNQIKTENPDISHKDAIAQSAAEWKDMSDDDKSSYVQRNAELKNLYTTAIQNYNSDSENTTTELQDNTTSKKTKSKTNKKKTKSPKN